MQRENAPATAKKENVRDLLFLFSVFRYPDISAKIGRLMDDYVLALRSKDETPGLLLAMTREAEAAILDKYQADVASKQQGIYSELVEQI